MTDEIERLRAERDALREALAFYAQHSVYTTNTVYMGGEHVETAIERDGGNRARAALKGDDRE